MEDFKVLNRRDISINIGGSGQWGHSDSVFKYRITKGPRLTFYFISRYGKDVKLCSIDLSISRYKGLKIPEVPLLQFFHRLCAWGHSIQFPFVSVDPEHEDVVWIDASCLGRVLKSEGFLV